MGIIRIFIAVEKELLSLTIKKKQKKKIINAYLKHGYSKNELSELEVWKIEDSLFYDSLDILEIWQ